MALSPNVVVVAPGEFITSQHLNNIRSNLDRLDTTRLPTAGGVMTGLLRSGASPTADQAGTDIRTDGVIQSAVTAAGGATAATSNIMCNRVGVSPGPADVGGVFVTFRRGAANQTGSITIGPSTSGTLYNTSSDERLKDVLGDVDDPLERVMALHPVRFAWKDDGYEQDGFIAHEVAGVAPYAVTGERGAVDDDGNIVPQMLDASALIALLTAAVQHLAGRVAELEQAAS